MRSALRQIAQRALQVRQAAYVFVNNRLEGNAPATIEAVISDLAARRCDSACWAYRGEGDGGGGPRHDRGRVAGVY
jgi:hypothetical protein